MFISSNPIQSALGKNKTPPTRDCAPFMKKNKVKSGQKYKTHVVPEDRNYSQDVARASDKNFNKWM